MPRGVVVAIVGAESTGKTTLAADLADALRARCRSVAVVGEYLREFCERQGRTPLRTEQAAIAAEQTRRIEVAAAEHGMVVADTTALMTAVYSDFVFGDLSLYPLANAAHRGVDRVLLTALDVPWQPDGLQRDGPQVRAPVDALLRRALACVGAPTVVIAGSRPQRVSRALDVVLREQQPRRPGE